MMTLLGALLGFFTSMLPEMVKLYQDKKDREHELAILALQLEQQKMQRSERLEAVHAEVENMQTKMLYRTYYSGVKWVDALNGTVRPMLAYAFFLLYALLKLIAVSEIVVSNMAFPYHLLWTQEDAAIFAGIISFYFGQRAFKRMREV